MGTKKTPSGEYKTYLSDKEDQDQGYQDLGETTDTPMIVIPSVTGLLAQSLMNVWSNFH